MRYLITGGTGYFGQMFARHILKKDKRATVCIYSRGEAAQAYMAKELASDRVRYFVGDVRDRHRLRRAMSGVDVVVHAAALKRIEVGLYNPDEMVKTNVIGAMNVIDAADHARVQKIVALSTDKACEPISAYGQSKALAESLFLAANEMQGHFSPAYSVVRYGNVAGSTGSVIPLWTKYPNSVKVTDPDCTRFWMFAHEAVDLVDRTIDVMDGGEMMIPPSLPAYRVGDLLEAMGIFNYEVVGLDPHEKKHESMRIGETSEHARRMSVDELREALKKL